MARVVVLTDLCDGCGVCITVCPQEVLQLKDGKARVVNQSNCLGGKAKPFCNDCRSTAELCIGCVACVRNCPVKAIAVLEEL